MRSKYVLWATAVLLALQILLAIIYYNNYVFDGRDIILQLTLMPGKIDIRTNGYNSQEMVDSWTRYKNEWSGEILVKYIGKKRLQFSEEYEEKMEKKGDHPLLKMYPDFAKRRKRIQNLCLEYPPEDNLLSFKIPGRYLYNQFYEIASCMPPKTSSTQWVEIFTQLAEFRTKFSWSRTAVLEYKNLSLAYYISNEQFIARAFQTYLKFTTARHPFERLASAYYDKLLDNTSVYTRNYGPDIIWYNYLDGYPTEETQLRQRLKQDDASNHEIQQKVRQLERMKDKNFNYKLTFIEFLTYITKFKDRRELEQHWRPMVLLCNPCTLQYDLILQFETMQRDANAVLDYVMREKQYGPKVKFPEKHVSITKEKCNKEFSNIPPDILKKLFDIYREDFLFYNYSTSNNNIC